ncbi:MAG TPA: fibronectin type III domain-containing protein [Longimicrobiales bacterium]|nr:fibronectin type III domain-containing protein [Longimicrobiales bacterium]
MLRLRNLRIGALALGVLLLGACSDDGTGPSPLGVPSGVSAPTTTQTSITLQWNAATGATGYVIERASAGVSYAQVGTATTPTFTDNGLSPDTEYRYRVLATRGSDRSAASTELIARTGAPGAQVAVIDADITANRTLYADTVYTLRGFIHVTNNATLTIQPGTTILGDYNTLGSSLFIMRGAKIDARGTAAEPIVFTSSQPESQRRPGDWGGLILVGNAVINRSDVYIEGTGTNETTNPRVYYSGGTDDADNSGWLQYVRVEFAGYATAADQELNSFTFAAVGSGTTLDHLQSLAGLDDSFEWFGGTVDATHLVSYESGDDHFDMSEGYSGRLQYLIAYQSKVLVPRTGAGGTSSDPQGIENDGCAGAGCGNGQLSQPYTLPVVANFTLIGTGPGHVDATSGGVGAVLRRGTGGYYVNGVIARWPKGALSIRDTVNTNQRIRAGELVLQNVYLTDNGGITFQTGTDRTVLDLAANSLVAGAVGSASLFNSLPTDPSSEAQFDWLPAVGSPIRTGGMNAFAGALAARAGTFVTPTAYVGAADPDGARWWEGWTNYADN